LVYDRSDANCRVGGGFVEHRRELFDAWSAYDANVEGRAAALPEKSCRPKLVIVGSHVIYTRRRASFIGYVALDISCGD
jgi:hypothetical protein